MKRQGWEEKIGSKSEKEIDLGKQINRGLKRCSEFPVLSLGNARERIKAKKTNKRAGKGQKLVTQQAAFSPQQTETNLAEEISHFQDIAICGNLRDTINMKETCGPFWRNEIYATHTDITSVG